MCPVVNCGARTVIVVQLVGQHVMRISKWSHCSSHCFSMIGTTVVPFSLFYFGISFQKAEH